MRIIRIIGVLFLILLGDGALFGQAEPDIKKPECPTVEVTGPAGITPPGEMAWFHASITGADPDALEISWRTSAGKIGKRDGKMKIGVTLTDDLGGLSITATVDVKGFPEGCSSSASETMSICLPLTWVQINEYSFPNRDINKRALSIAAVELENNPNNQMYIIEYFPRKNSRASIDRKIKRVREYFSLLKFDISRVTIVTAEAEGNVLLTKIYRVPPGASNPVP